MTIANVGVICPNCSKMARLIDGNYDFVNYAITVRTADPRDVEILKILQTALRAAMNNDSSGATIAHLAAASPEFAKYAQEAATKFGIPTLILVLYALLYSCSTQANLNWNELVDQFHVYLTDAAPYPSEERRDAQENMPQRPQALNRHQRRQQEHRAKKQQRQTAPQNRSKPKR